MKGYPKHNAVADPGRAAIPTVVRDPVKIKPLPREYRFRSPINDNIGSQNGECALRCLEEFSNSWQETRALGLNCDYW